MDQFIITYKNAQEDDITLTITDRESTTSGSYSLTGTRCVIRNTNNDENKFSPIRAMEAEFTFINSTTFDLDYFTSGGANRFKVEIDIEGSNLFTGYLVPEDMEELYLPKGKVEVRMIATDGLGLLKQKKLNETSQGELGSCTEPNYSFIRYISIALSVLELDLDINVVNNLYEGYMDNRDDDPDACMFNQAYLDYRTFKKNFTEWDDCYTVLEKILGYNYFITQHLGKWWIVRVDEYYRNYGFSYTTYNSNGIVQGSTLDDTTFTGDPFSTGRTDFNDTVTPLLRFKDEEATYQKIRPAKSVRLNYTLDQWDEVPMNNTFVRGDETEDNTTWKKFNLDDWTDGIEQASAISLASASSPAYIRRNYDGLGLEADRYLVIPHESGGHSVRSCEIPLKEKDVIEVSVDYAFSADSSASGTVSNGIMYFFLFGDDGSYWTMSYGSVSNTDGEWVQSNGTFTTNLKLVNDRHDATGLDQTDRRSFTATSLPLPTDGTLYIQLRNINFNNEGADAYFSNLRFTYKAYINDSYAPVKSQYNKVYSINSYLKTIEDDVYVGSSPRRLFKGAILRYDGSDYVLTNQWSNWVSTATGAQVPPVIGLGTYSKFQIFALWNQEGFYQRKFRYNLYGLKNANGDYLSILFKVGVSTFSAGYMFFNTDMERDLINCEIRGTMIQIYDQNTDYDVAAGDTITSGYTGRWWTLVYNTGGGNQTKYFLDAASATPSGYYRQNTPSVPPFPGTVSISDFTYVGSGLSDLMAYLGITYPQLVSFTYSGSDSTITSTTTQYSTLHEFKYIVE